VVTPQQDLAQKKNNSAEDLVSTENEAKKAGTT
jgi:hypothetical protein